MLNLFKMDLQRLLRGKVLYIMIGVLTSIVASTVIMAGTQANFLFLIGGVAHENAEMAFLGGSMGVGSIYSILGLITMLFICSDYSSGFAKNIFSVHTKKWDYFFSKLFTMMVASAVLIVVFIIETVVLSAIIGVDMSINSPIAIIAFFLQKWLISGAFVAIYIFINVLTRNIAIGTVAAFLIGSGGLVMGLILFFEIVGIDGSIITESTIHGASTIILAEFNIITTLRIIVTGTAWAALYGWLSNKILIKKDVV